MFKSTGRWCTCRKNHESIKETESYQPNEPRVSAPPKYTSPGKNWKHYLMVKAVLKIDRRAASEEPIDYTMALARWKVKDSTVIACPRYGDIITRHYFNNYRLRLDYYIPEYPDWVINDWCGNSSVYLNES